MKWTSLLTMLMMGLTSVNAQRPVFKDDFERKRADSTITFEKHDQLELIEREGVDTSTALRATYEPFDEGTKRIVVKHKLPPALEYTLNYDVKFESDFQFVRGGKLHGLSPKKPVTGGKEGRPDGWSARIMFRREGAMTNYDYHQNQPGKYGDRGEPLVKSFRFQKERWTSVSIHVRINEDPSRATGFNDVYVDGKLIERHDNVQWRAVATKETLINYFLFSTFHGGHTRDWAPKDKEGNSVAVHALFDNIAVYPGKHVRKSPGKDW